MRMVILKICLAFIYFSTTAQSNFDSKTTKKIAENKVRAITNYNHQYSGGQPSGSGQKTAYTTYNPSGFITEMKAFNRKGDVINVEKYNYDQAGNRTLYERYKGGSLGYRKISQYNSNGDITLETGFNGTQKFKNVYNYNPDGSLKEIIYYTSNIIDEKRVYEHSNNIAKIKVYNSGNLNITNLTLTYDSKGNLLEETVCTPNNIELEKKIYKYNGNSQVLSEAIYRQGKLIYETINTYNQKGDIIEIAQKYAGQSKYIKKSYSYDHNSNLTELKWRRNADDKFNIKSYKYNENGLCISENTFYAQSENQTLTKYTYEYY